MRLTELYNALKIFKGAFNRRPGTQLYFNEKLFTEKQLQDYDEAIQTLERSLAKKQADEKQRKNAAENDAR